MDLAYDFVQIAVTFVSHHWAVLEGLSYAFLSMEDFPMSVYYLLDWGVVSIIGCREGSACILPFGFAFQ